MYNYSLKRIKKLMDYAREKKYEYKQFIKYIYKICISNKY